MGKEVKVVAPFFWQRFSLGERSWVDVVHDRVERSSMNRWLVYFVVGVTMILLLHGLHWISGALPVGRFDSPLLFTAIVAVMSVAFAHHLDRVALQCLHRFRPALSSDENEFMRLSHVLTTMPALPVLVSQLVGLPLFASIIRFDPTFYGLLHGNPLSDIPVYAIGLLNNGILIVNLYHTIHQLSWVQSVHARAKAVSIIDRAPAFAFSTLTYWTAVCGIILVYGLIYLFPALRRDPVAVAMAGSAVLLLLLTFFLPLQGMHMRLAEDKEQRLGHVRQQIDATFALLQEHRKANDLVAAEQLAKQLPSLIQEEEYLGKLPTWPWQPGTVTKLMTVALLPILLIVAERIISRLMS